MRKTYIKVSFQKEGIHKYPAAKDLPGVEFLQYPHRHMFHFYVTMEVFHDDRDVEFILLKRELESLYSEGTLQLDYKSCEMICNDIMDYLHAEYPNRGLQVEVYEDNENGGIVKNDLFD
mgnify:CR=1 FL=1|jgi:uncharacterized protein YqgQ